MTPRLVDTHCHLDQFEDPQAVLAVAAAQGVARVVAVSEDPESMQAVLELKRRFPRRVAAGIGLHPAWVVRRARPEIERALSRMAEQADEADLIGEIGLDYKWAGSAEEQALQREILQAQLEIAAACEKPVCLHSRRALRQTLEQAVAFRRRTRLNVQMHWFTHSKKLIRICNEEGIFVSVGPTVVGHGPTQEAAKAIDDGLLLLETDAPVPVQGRKGHPARTREVAEVVAELKGVSWEEIAERTASNFARFTGR